LPRFIEDLKSGKLHREYHFGPDSTTVKEDEKSGQKRQPQKELPKLDRQIDENQVKSNDDNVCIIKF
jgi:hypothetical protein